MFPNFPLLRIQSMGEPQFWRANMDLLGEREKTPDGYPAGRNIQPAVEERLQARWVKEVLGSYRKLMPPETRDNPVVCVRGNHDFVDLSEAFGGDVWEVTLDPTRTTTVCGLKVGGCRGIAYILGEWSDELTEVGKWPEPGVPIRPPVGVFEDVVAQLPTDLEVLLTHAPPHGILDRAPNGENYGTRALTNYHMERAYVWGRLKAHFFGHVHSARGSKSAGVLFSNAATGHIVYEI